MKARCIIYNLKTHKVLVYVTVVIILVLALNELYGGGNGRRYRAPRALRRYMRHRDDRPMPDVVLSSAQADALRRRLVELNDNYSGINSWSEFGRVERDTTLIVVQVHRDLVRLQYLIVSLAQVRDIETTVLIFSHGYYDERINELVRSVSFCKVMQIFFPYSPQLYPNKFPGPDPSDSADGSGGRDAWRTQHKQHWWWKAHFVFSRAGVEWPAAHNGMVLLLEEHDFVAPDALHVLRYAQHALTSHPWARLVTLGMAHSGGGDFDLLTLETWQPIYGIGLALNSTAWRLIVELTKHFCMFDDSSWSYSLLNVLGELSGGAADVVAAVAPRVVSLREAPPDQGAAARTAALRGAALFPAEVRCVTVWGTGGHVKRVPQRTRGAGGWSDLRDQMLCLDPLLSTTTDTDNAEGDSTVQYHVAF